MSQKRTNKTIAGEGEIIAFDSSEYIIKFRYKGNFYIYRYDATNTMGRTTIMQVSPAPTKHIYDSHNMVPTTDHGREVYEALQEQRLKRAGVKSPFQ